MKFTWNRVIQKQNTYNSITSDNPHNSVYDEKSTTVRNKSITLKLLPFLQMVFLDYGSLHIVSVKILKYVDHDFWTWIFTIVQGRKIVIIDSILHSKIQLQILDKTFRIIKRWMYL